MKKEIAIVYMVAGISARFNGKVKQLAIVGPNNESLIEYSLNQALKAGFNKIIFIVGNKTEKIFKETFGTAYKGVPVEYAYQYFNESTRDKPWGTCDALCSIKDIINSPFVVCNGDDIYGEKTLKLLYNHLLKNNTSATIGYKLSNVLPNYGKTNRAIFKTNNSDFVKEIKEYYDVEKFKLPEQELNEYNQCSMNIFALQKDTLYNLYERLNKFKQENATDRKKECLIQHELSGLIKENLLTMQLLEEKDRWLGITNPEDEKTVKELLSNKSKDITIVYMVAGLSSRFGGRIKQFASIGPDEESLIELSMNQAINVGFNKIILIVGNKTENLFKTRFGLFYKGIPIEYAYQNYDPLTREKPWGTCDAVCTIKEIIKTPFVVCTGDDIYGEKTLQILYDHLKNNDNEATIGSFLKDNISKYGSVNRGLFKVDYENNVTDIKETLGISKEDVGTKYDPEALTSLSIFALHETTIKLLNEKLTKFKQEHLNSSTIECFLPEKLTELINEKLISMKLYKTDSKTISITNPEDEELARSQLLEKC